MATSVFDQFKPYREQIQQAMQDCFTELPGTFDFDLSAQGKLALQHLQEYSLRPGKRIRGSLGALTYDAATASKLTGPGIQLGVALELVQNYLLIVDDVMDKSKLRRGQPTLHELYLEQSTGYGGKHEADMLAINVGIEAQHLANLVIARLNLPPERLRQAFLLLHNNIAATGFGQIDDLFQQPGRSITGEEIMRKYELKSSYYTFINPMKLGFVLAGKADSTILQACHEFGKAAGVAFQLRDDVLGIFGETSQTGKPNLDDVREGKYTLLVHYVLEHATPDDQKALRVILGNAKASEADLRMVQGIMERSGARQHVETAIVACAEAAKRVLRDNAFGNDTYCIVLSGLVDYCVERQA